jgi:hypothetical protein
LFILGSPEKEVSPMITDRQLQTVPAEAPVEAPDDTPVLVQLLNEIEREEAERQPPAPRRQTAARLVPRPFAHD